ncbi:hypothetical protein L1987_31294 [Smallanthus sonchifolius]|uniref:Uncharacterized protein n=1 Tax=Smallanthus sonchifolius TaxID=185202 RepID=A0ACB9I582_9ASTR|nr:hypothetical protein L1987_31294 [Smallanthus sonchifolius]
MADLRRHRKLPMDIIESEILPRLPAKSIGRFMSVCKHWQSLLSTQDFHQKNHRHITTVEPQTHQKLLLLNAPAGSFSTRSSRMDGDGGGWMKVVGYCGEKNIPFSLTPNCKVRHGKWDVTWVFNEALEKVDVTTDKGILEVTYRETSLYDLVRAIYVETLVSPNP